MPTTTPLMMTLDQFAELHGITRRTAERCLKGESKSYPPLKAKRARTGTGPGRIYITAEQAAEWRAQLEDA